MANWFLIYKIRGISVCVLSALSLILVCYFADNLAISLLTGPSVGQKIEQIKEVTGDAREASTDGYLFVDVAFDKELVPIYDVEFPLGEIDITHRGKLTEFLSQLEGQHKYVMLDVLLDKNYKSEHDSALVETILHTPRIAVARTADSRLIDSRLDSLSGFTDYSTHIYETNFVKYEFITENGNSLPYRAFLDENPEDKLYSFGPFYFQGDNLAWKSLTLRFPIKMWGNTKSSSGPAAANESSTFTVHPLGGEILFAALDVPTLVKNKIVVIGDFSDVDIHDTYLGKVSGPVINTNALEALRNGELKIPWWLIVFLFFLYSGFTWFAIRGIPHTQFTDKWIFSLRPKSKFWRYLLSFVGYSFVLSVISGIIYLIAGVDINVLIPSLWFTFLHGIRKWFLQKPQNSL